MRHVCRKTLTYFVFSFVALMAFSCQSSQYSTSGLPSPSTDYSTTTTGYDAVVMIIAPSNSGLCTGTFISERAVLTASHCVSTSGQYTIVSSFGRFYTSTVEAYGPGVVADPNDIAILVLSEDSASRSAGQIYDIHDSVAAGDTLRLVGYGCNDIDARTGAGVKRTGTNVVSSLSDYIEFLTPRDSLQSATVSANARGILGPSNRAASCFGDSGGPALLDVNGTLHVVGVTHAGGASSTTLVSEYVNVGTRGDNRTWIAGINRTYSLNISGF